MNMTMMKTADIKIIPITDQIKLKYLEDSEYFALSDYISNSSLSTINPLEDGSPEKYLSFLEQETKEYNSSYNLGSSVHQLILQPHNYFLDEAILKPSGKLYNIIDEIIINRRKQLPIKTSIILACKKYSYYENSLSDKRIKNLIIDCIPFYFYYIKNYKKELGRAPVFLDKSIVEKVTTMVRNIKNDTFFICLA